LPSCHYSFGLLLAAGNIIDVTAVGVLRPLLSLSANFLSKHLSWFCLTERGSCMHSHSHSQRLDHLLYYLSIFAWTLGCSRSERVSVSSPWIQRSPTFCPWVEEERSAETKKNLVRYDHPRSRGIGSTQLPETSLLS
jgi:hypothetical protein